VFVQHAFHFGDYTFVMTIRTRLTLWYSALLATVILVFGVSLFTLLNWAWYSQLRENMNDVSQQVRSIVTFDETGTMIKPLRKMQFAQTTHFLYAVQLHRANGDILWSTDNLSSYPEAFDPQNVNSLVPVSRDFKLPVDGTHVLVYTEPIFSPKRSNVLAGSIQILASLNTLEAATERLLRVMIGVGIVALVLSFMMGSVIAAQALQPIEAISNAARQITAADDLSKRVPYDGPQDELFQLTTTFNTTLERLERLFNAQRRFVADVSHELRTPLTILQGNLDLMKRMGPNAASLADMESDVKRMTRLVGDLLMLAQADSGRLPLREQPVELVTLVVEVLQQTKLFSGNVTVKVGRIDPVRVMGDPDRLKQLMLNLVTNAIKYSPDGGEVTISAYPEGAFAILKVSDTGIGIPKEDLPYIFDRFYRVDKARSRAMGGAEMGGAGLGLSIVRWITEAHRGRVYAESEVGKGSTFTVMLPNLDAPRPPESTRETRRAVQIVPPNLRRLKPE
jgi:signal transduction histidine kinase